MSPEPILVEAAWKWIAYDETAAWRYRQLVANTGSSKKAIVAMARQLGVLLWRLSIYGELYEITRVDPKVLWALDYHRLRERFARKIVGISPLRSEVEVEAKERNMPRAYLVGSGIASLAAVAYLIRDGRFPGDDIHIFEQADIVGGSLDGAGSPDTGYVIRGGRMFNFTYVCTYDLLSFIPSLTDPHKTVRDEIAEFNERVKTHSNCRLVEHGRKLDVSTMGFSHQDRLDLLGVMLHSEESFGTRRIDECFVPAFFKTNFWLMWATMFGFQPWHSAVEFKRYLHRFIHEFPRISTLAGVDRTPYNQYDSIIRPITEWLKGQGVLFKMRSQVTSLEFKPGTGQSTVQRIQYIHDGQPREIALAPGDYVFVTNGSMTADSMLGTMTTPAPMKTDPRADGAWALWEDLAKERPEFGHPSVFDGHVAESYWPSGPARHL